MAGLSPESRHSHHSGSEDLQKRLENATHTEERIRILLAAASSLKRRNPSEALEHALRALQLSRSSGNVSLTADSLHLSGHIQAIVGRYTAALGDLREAHRLFRQMRDEQKEHETLHLIAEIHKQLGELDEALRMFERNLEYFTAREDARWIIRTLIALGMIYKVQTDHAAAIAVFLQAIDLAEREDLPEELCRLYNGLALTYRQIGDLDRSIDLFRTALQLYDQLDDHLGGAIAHVNLGDTHLRRNHFTPAVRHLTHALRIFRRIGQPGREANAWNGLGVAYRDQGDLPKAERCFLKALEIMEQIEPTHFIISIYRNFALLCNLKGEYRRGIGFGEKGLEAARKQNEPIWQGECADILSILHERLGNLQEALRYAILYREKKGQSFAAEKIQSAIEVEMHRRIENLQNEVQQKEDNLQELRALLERKDLTLSTMALQLLQNESSKTSRGKEKKTGSSLRQPDSGESWEQLVGQISKVDQRFYGELARTYPQLSATERKVCTLIRIGLVSKEISTLLGISVRTVEVHRTNIRRKLEVPQTTPLTSFIASL